MIRNKKERSAPIIIDLSGPEGNAYALITYANNLGKQLGWDPKKRGEINAEMMEGDYENLLKVFDFYFGNFVTLER